MGQKFCAPVEPCNRGLLFGRKLSLLSPSRLDSALARAWNNRLVAYSRSNQLQHLDVRVVSPHVKNLLVAHPVVLPNRMPRGETRERESEFGM